MGIERNLKDRKGRENRRHRQWMKMSPVQKLFLACQHVFGNASPGVVPSSQHIDLLRSVLAGIKPEDLGLKPDMPYFTNNNAGTPKITYLHIFECEKFSMGIFCLPPSAVIPLHNHPEMTVFSKLLFGKMHIKSYDWAVNLPADVSPNQTMEKRRLAKVKVDADFTAPCDPSILYPNDGGNMHCFTAVTACAVLDVLGPPYSDPDGRHCAYYQSFPFSIFPVDGTFIAEEEKKEYEWLEEREKPESLQVIVKMYSSPKIMEN